MGYDFIYFNIGGMLTKDLDELKCVMKDYCPKCVAISETHLTHDIDDKIYDMSDLDYEAIPVMSHSVHTGGVVIYLKKYINFEIIKEESDDMMWSVIIKLKNVSENIIVGVFYRSPSSPLSVQIERMEAWFQNLDRYKRVYKIYLAGDANINLFHDNKYSKQLKDLIKQEGFHQVIEEATRVTNLTATLIDHIYSNDEVATYTKIVKYQISDHEIFAVDWKLNIRKDEEEKVIIPGAIDFFKLREKLKCLNYNNKLTAEESYRYLYEEITKVCEDSRNEATILKKKKYNPFFSKEVLMARKEKTKKYTKFRYFKILWEEEASVENRNKLDSAWAEYKTARNKYTTAYRNGKNNLIKAKLKECGKDQKKIWRHLKKLLYIPKQKIQTVWVNDVEVDDDREIAQTLNKFFVESIIEITSQISNVPEPQLFRDIEKINIETELTDVIKPSIGKLERIIGEFKNNGDIQPNGKMLKECWPQLQVIIHNFIHKCIDECIMPQRLKVATITPIPKIKKAKNLEEFRPINVLAAVEKLLESIYHEALLKHIKENKILTPVQSGFREKHSTESVLQYLLETWRVEINNSKKIVAVFLDLKRAFETIDRTRLLRKLENIGVKGNVLLWCKNYLQGRKQCVKVGNTISDEINVDLGVPQGSKLGTILFILYINSLPSLLKNCQVQLFADDTLIYIVGDDLEILVRQINEELELIAKWMDVNKLAVNAKKTKCMVISKTGETPDFKVELKGVELEYVDCIKYLGVHLDNKLNLKIHFEKVHSKIRQKTALFRQLKYKIHRSTKLTVYNAIIKPHLDYCATIMYTANKEVINKIQITINQAMRIILEESYETPIRTMLERLDWMTVEENVYLSVMVFVFKIDKNMTPGYLKLTPRFKDIHSYMTRNRQNMMQLLQPTRRSIFNEGISEYNEIEKEYREMQNIKKFKEALRKKTMEKRNT